MFKCFGTHIYNYEIRNEGSGQTWNNDWASWSNVLDSNPLVTGEMQS